MKSFFSHLECTYCKKIWPSEEIYTVCPDCGKVLFPCYELQSVRTQTSKTKIKNRPRSLGMWRWFELLPIRNENNIVTLGEGDTPLLPARNLGNIFGASHLFIKEEGINPTGTFKSRGLSAAVSKAKELGIKKIAMPSAGNAGAALSAYGARAGMEIFVFIPEDASELIKREISIYGSTVYLVNGLINDAGVIVKQNSPHHNWFDVSTLKEPYRVEGKKTLGFELAEQFQWELPDAIIYPAGGGTGVVGMWKAFNELEQLGWVGEKKPKMIIVQAEGCAPIVSAFEKNMHHSEIWENAHTIAGGIRVPGAIGDYLMLDILENSIGKALTVSDEEILCAIKEIAQLEGIFSCPEGAACYAAYKKLVSDEFLKPEDKVVLFNTGSGLKTTDLISANYVSLDPEDPNIFSKIEKSLIKIPN